MKRSLDVSGLAASGSAAPGGINPYSGRPLSSRYFTILESRKRLPVWEQRDGFFELVKKHQSIVLVGETGSGKTTQIPSMMVEAVHGRGKRMIACTQVRKRRDHISRATTLPAHHTIACTQPRRVAAMSVSKRVTTFPA